MLYRGLRRLANAEKSAVLKSRKATTLASRIVASERANQLNQIKQMQQVEDKPAIGVLMLDYPDLEYALGDVGNPNSFACDVHYEKVSGLDFKTCQHGVLNNELEGKITQAVKKLEERGARAIIGDCGFMLHYHRFVSEITDVPVMLSSVCQLPLMQLMLGKKEKIAILTANCETFNMPSMQRLLVEYGVAEGSLEKHERSFGEDLESDRLVVVGLKQLPGFDAITNGTNKDCNMIRQSLVEKMEEVLQAHPDIKGILSECTMIPGYSSALRRSFNLPVLDALTSADILLKSRGAVVSTNQVADKNLSMQSQDIDFAEPVDTFEPAGVAWNPQLQLA